MSLATGKTRTKLEVAVERPTPYTFDLGLLLANDANPINTSTPAESTSMGVDPLEAQLIATARDGAQGLINQLLTTCPISSTPQGVLLSLPPPSTSLPREKPVPEPKAPTKWEQFAAKRGIKPTTREQRRMKSQKYNEETGQWEKTWGFNKDGRIDRKEKGMVQQDWLVEVDEKKEREDKEARRKAMKGKKK
ncbi:ribosomal biogenesis regulatory protein [Xylaria bambusicola]|uniref:ribosomal biogenesis regulatory protein n=1 Tax=Xylaria bambusicola TaxID=326684 RepID=UPI00200873C2|nr:ribosomal biogenesis regulatory protein [Xylaria bambusicola]KAI0515208.1 ribosomal biogenesis regulatory protein [Xylaria bambusicola]